MSRLSKYLNRSSQVLRDGTSRSAYIFSFQYRIRLIKLPVLRMTGADEPSRAPMTLFTLNSRENLSHFATGCDADIGGLSSAKLELDESTADPSSGVKALQPPRPSAKFWGSMRLGVRSGFEGRVRGGYAGFRNQVWLAIVATRQGVDLLQLSISLGQLCLGK